MSFITASIKWVLPNAPFALKIHNIILDFPGSQNLSAADLVKASAMYFHIVNEKFAPSNATLADCCQPISCKMSGMKLSSPIAKISKASMKLPGSIWAADTLTAGSMRPRSDNAKLLYDNGLALA